MTDATPTEATHAANRQDAEQGIPEQMRADVGLLGSLLGQVLRESGSEGLYDDVEALRTATIDAYTSTDPAVFERAADIAASFSTERADEVARAFTCYFHLANLAEEHQRVRALRSRARDHSRRDTVAGAYAALREEVGDDEALRRLRALRFHPVFTAHPTEARRRAISTSIRRIADLMTERDAAADNITDSIQQALLAEIDTLWRTAPIRTEKPKPTDEVRAIMAIFDETLFTAVPQVYRDVDNAIQTNDDGHLPGATPPEIEPFLRFGTWVGGDRDGNPFVTAKVTRSAAAIASEHVLRGLENAASRIGRQLTLDEETTPASSALKSRLAELTEADEDAAVEIAERSPNELHRRMLLLLTRKIRATRERNADLAYGEPKELLADLELIRASLADAGAARQAYGEVQSLIWQVQTYGFHLAHIEVRQHSAVHAKALEELRAGGELSEQTEEVLETIRTIGRLQRRYGPRAAGRYIVSFTQSAEDLAAVHELARFAVGEDGKPPELDVIPLFETFADLQHAPGILAETAHTPQVEARLAATNRRMEVMLGYSDSSKDVGPVAATLALADAQRLIADWAEDEGIELTLFHGRGGALGRGGGPANSAILAQPPHSVDGRFKLTEQGEVIFARYGDPDIARRHIDQVAAAILVASTPSNEERNHDAAERFADMAAVMEDASKDRFFELVKAEGFPAWFATVTPMEEVGLLALGSRPARRGLSVESLADLRAIPWVFAWTQARINLAGWFGLGTALDAVDDVDKLRDAYESWPLFRTMIDNVAMSLAKTDSRIAREYLALGDRDDLAELVLSEMDLTREWVIRIVGGDDLLENKPVLKRAVALRSPYVDALSLLQLRALRALRDSDAETPDPAQQHLLLLTVSGVAAGLQNTG